MTRRGKRKVITAVIGILVVILATALVVRACQFAVQSEPAEVVEEIVRPPVAEPPDAVPEPPPDPDPPSVPPPSPPVIESPSRSESIPDEPAPVTAPTPVPDRPVPDPPAPQPLAPIPAPLDPVPDPPAPEPPAPMPAPGEPVPDEPLPAPEPTHERVEPPVVAFSDPVELTPPKPPLTPEPTTTEPAPEPEHAPGIVGPESPPAPEPVPEQPPEPVDVVADPYGESASVGPEIDEPIAAVPAPIVQPHPTIDDGFVFVQGGEYARGSETGDRDERPRHSVRVGAFFISPFVVTQAEWRRVRGVATPYHVGPNLPIENIGWLEAIEYCNVLSRLTGLTPAYEIRNDTVMWDREANGYRLPSEAEWEFAALGGVLSAGYRFSGSDDPGEVAWYRINSEGSAQPVARKKPNELGLFDMSGNVWEWVWDRYGPYDPSESDNPAGPNTGDNRVVKGGSWYTAERTLRPSARLGFPPGGRASYIGFRPVRNAR